MKLLKKLHLENLQQEQKYIEKLYFARMKIDHVSLKDAEAVPFQFHIGMRTIKTVLCVFLCGLISWMMNQSPLFAMFSAILCLQNKTDETIINAFNRILGTIVGGLFCVVFLFLWEFFSESYDSLLYYTVISLALIPIIATTLVMRKPTVTALSCIVFVAICLTLTDDFTPFEQAFLRTIDTLLGIVVTVFIELLFPYAPPPLSET